MIPGFLSNRRRDLERLREAMAAGDLGAVGGIGHTLRGVGGGYGFHGISQIGERIESAAGMQRREDAQAAIDELASYLARVRVQT